MSGAGFILAINLAVAGLLALAFAAIAFYDGDRRAARWFAASYAAGGLALSVEFLIAGFGLGRAGLVATFGGFLAATLLFNCGLARRFDLRPPWAAMLALLAVSLVSTAIVFDWPRHAFARQLVYQSPYALMQGIGLWILLRARAPSRLDRAFAALLALSALHFLVKPALAGLAGGTGTVPEAYLDTAYAMISLSLGTVFAFALALAMLTLLVRDSLSDALGRAETDTLSRLCNRGGFERRSAPLFAEATQRGVPVALVLADLDHFKRINDTFGHAAGDRVIAGFARLVRDAALRDGALAARIGGEEFAVLLPGVALGAARLWAEGVRAVLGAGAVEGLPDGRRVTASFGVAEWQPGEGLSGLLHRADGALYEAKAAGRDCVRLSAAHRTDRWERDGVALPHQEPLPASATGTVPVTRRYFRSSSGER